MTQKESCPPAPLRQGLITIFTGDGRGKTSAAIGTAVRAAGHGLRVFIVFFMKGKLFTHGEVLALARLPNVTTASFGQEGWVKRGQTRPEHKEQALRALECGREAMLGGKYDLVIMDEICGAVDYDLLPVDKVAQLLGEKPAAVDLILTGLNAHTRLVDRADVVTEMRCIKHPFSRGTQAREGIDY